MIPLGVLASSRHVPPSGGDYRTDIAVVDSAYGIVWVGRWVGNGANQVAVRVNPANDGDAYVDSSGRTWGARPAAASMEGAIVRAHLLDPIYPPRTFYVGQTATATALWAGDMRWRVVPSGTTPAEAAAIQDALLEGF